MTPLPHSWLPLTRHPGNLDAQSVASILIVGSASPFNVGRAVETARERFPQARLLVLQPRRREAGVQYGAGVTAIDWPGLRGFPALRRVLARTDYDLKLVLFTGEGYNILKLLTFLLPARRMLVFTEGGGIFEWCYEERYTIRNHVRWRLRGWNPGRALRGAVSAAANASLAALGFCDLLLWHARFFVHPFDCTLDLCRCGDVQQSPGHCRLPARPAGVRWRAAGDHGGRQCLKRWHGGGGGCIFPVDSLVAQPGESGLWRRQQPGLCRQQRRTPGNRQS
jgi:hypothetical protein